MMIMNKLFKTFYLSLILILVATMLNGCGVIGDIFEAGVWIGVIVTIAVVGLIVFIIVKIIQKIF